MIIGFSLTKKGNLKVDEVAPWDRTKAQSSHVWKTPICCGNEKRYKDFRFNLLINRYKRACRTPMEEWTQSLGAAWFWMQGQDKEAIILTAKLVPYKQGFRTKQLRIAYKLLHRYPRFKQLTKNNHALAHYVLRAALKKRGPFKRNPTWKGIYKIFGMRQNKLVKLLWDSLFPRRLEGTFIPTAKMLKKITGSAHGISYTDFKLPIKPLLDKLPVLHEARIDTLNYAYEMTEDLRKFNTKLFMQVTNKKSQCGSLIQAESQKLYTLRDIARMNYDFKTAANLEQGDYPILPDKFNTWEQLDQFHQQQIMLQTKIKRNLEDTSYQIKYKSPLELPPDGSITFLDNRAALEDEGARMRHCVGSYHREVEGGRAAIYHVEHDDEKATLEIGKPYTDEKKWRERQLYGPCNQEPSPSLRMRVKLWLEEAQEEVA